MVSPKEGLTAANDKALADKLQAYKAALSQEKILKIVEETHALHDYQDAGDSPEALSKIPMLTRADMKKEAEGFVNEERVAGDTKVLFHQLQTNGIGYVKLVFDVSNIPQELFAYMGILKNVLGYVDTQNYSYGELYNEINIHTGGISSTVNTYTNSKKLDEYSLTFEVKTKAMYGELANTFALLQEIMTTSRMDDRDRIYEIIAELKSRMQGSMTSSGHSLAAIRALSYFSETAAIMELVSGMPCYRLLEKLEAEYDSYKDELADKLKQLAQCIFRPENLMLMDYTAEEEGYETFAKLIPGLKASLYTTQVLKEKLQIVLNKLNEGFATSAQIQYVARAGSYKGNGYDYPYTGALRVLKVIMGYDYLWINVRVKGGSYGCMCELCQTARAISYPIVILT